MASAPRATGATLAISAWAVLGVVAILVQAIVRLLPYALEPLRGGEVELGVALSYLAAIGLLGYAEGYRGFQRSFSPRAAVRAMAAARAPTRVKLIAPLMAMGLIHATRRRLIVSWTLVVTIVGFIVSVRLLPQPWRGAVDAGVVVGLSWGVVTLLSSWIAAVNGRAPAVDAELPGA